MSPMLLSASRKKRVLPPHGYEGRRAVPTFVPPPLATPPLPSAEELTKRGFSFESVGPAVGPVRLKLHGRPLGVFITREAASATIKHCSS